MLLSVVDLVLPEVTLEAGESLGDPDDSEQLVEVPPPEVEKGDTPTPDEEALLLEATGDTATMWRA